MSYNCQSFPEWEQVLRALSFILPSKFRRNQRRTDTTGNLYDSRTSVDFHFQRFSSLTHLTPT